MTGQDESGGGDPGRGAAYPGWPGALDEHRPATENDRRAVPATQQLSATLVRALGLDGAAVAMIGDTGERDLVHAVFALPLVTGAVRFGVLELYRRTPGPLAAEAQQTAGVDVEPLTKVALTELFGPQTDLETSWPVRLTVEHTEVVAVEGARARDGHVGVRGEGVSGAA